MMVPGSNLLNLAMTVIQKQTLKYFAYIGRTSNDIGIYQDAYAAPVTVQGSIQPVARTVYSHMGLDFQKNYHTIYVPQYVNDVDRVQAGDKFSYNGVIFQCESTTPWFQMDKWTKALCVEVPPDTELEYYTNENGLPYYTEDGLQQYQTE